MEVALYLGNCRIITIGLKYHVFLKAGIYVNIHSAVGWDGLTKFLTSLIVKVLESMRPITAAYGKTENAKNSLDALP